MSETMNFKAKKVFSKCIVCGEQSMVEFEDTTADQEGFDAWSKGEFVQVAFWHWTPEKRETLISGTHPKCFEVLTLPEDDEEETNG